MLSLPSQATQAQRLPGHHSRTCIVLRRRALLHVPQTVLRKMRCPSCAVEPMPLLGALDLDLHSRVFLGCRNIACAVCRSVAHSTTNCPRINPSATPCPEPTSAKSTSYVPRPATVSYSDHEPPAPYAADNRQPCFSFNNRKCGRLRCCYLHICSFCGGAHARIVCPVSKAANKKYKNYPSTNSSYSSSGHRTHPPSG